MFPYRRGHFTLEETKKQRFRHEMKKTVLAAILLGLMLTACQENKQSEKKMETNLELTQEWDKVFPQSSKVNHQKVTFHNRYGITLAADMYMPKGAEGRKLASSASAAGAAWP